MNFWRGELTSEEILYIFGEIKKIRKISTDGKVSFVGGGFDDWVSIIASALGIDIRTGTLRSRIVRGALASPKLKGDFSESDFKQIVYRLQNKYQNKETAIHKVVFPIWNKPKFLHGVKKIDDVTINFSPSARTPFYKKMSQERDQQRLYEGFQEFFTNEFLNDLNQCSIIIAHVKANSAADANERASEAIHEVLGLVNLARDGGKQWRISFRTRGKLPVSEILICPHITTHFKNGKLSNDGYWDENWVGGPEQKNLKAKVLSAWESRFNQLTKSAVHSKWRQECKASAVRYYKAFSNPNLEESFLDGWRLFENVTGLRFEKINNQIIRVSNVFEDNIEYHIIGKHLAFRRNMITHGFPVKMDDEEVLAFQMLRFIVPYMKLFILNGFSFHSLKDFWDFLDLPPSKADRDQERSELNRQLVLLDNAAKFRGETHS